MSFSDFHFAHPLWLVSLLAVPVILLLKLVLRQDHPSSKNLEQYIDKHLLPFLLVNSSESKKSFWRPFLLWAITWTFLSVALAGPRWNYDEIEIYSKDQNLVILLDLSKSMDAQDIKPSRLTRAKQKIEDLLNRAQGVNIALIAFAADPHMITPLTDDKETIRYLLHSLGTDLIFVQGSRLTPALEMAKTVLDTSPGSNKSVLVISDGGFEDASAITKARELASEGITVNTMGVGTSQGAPVQDKKGNFVNKEGRQIITSLEKRKLQEIDKAGNGRYFDAGYSDNGEVALLRDLEKRANAQEVSNKKTRFWEEHFYLFIFPTLPILLWWFRKGYMITALLLCLTTGTVLEGATIDTYFKNKAQLGKQALDDGDTETATQLFDDPYRKGVAAYRAGNYEEAEQFFRESRREEVAEKATYNLGNALAQQKKFEDAAKAYKDVLKQWPENQKAKDNLEIVKKMLQEQQQQNNDNTDGSSQDNPQKKESESQEKEEKGGSQEKKDNTKDRQSEGGEQSTDEQPEPNEQAQEKQQQDIGQQKEEERDQDTNKEQGVAGEQQEPDANGEKQSSPAKSQKDLDADLWLNRISQDPKQFLKNKFTIDSKRQGTKEGIDPW